MGLWRPSSCEASEFIKSLFYFLLLSRDEKDNFFTEARFDPKKNTRKSKYFTTKLICNQNSVKGPKDTKSEKKLPKSNIKSQNVQKTLRKAQNCYITHKTPYNFAKILPEISFLYMNIVRMFVHFLSLLLSYTIVWSLTLKK